MSVPNNTEKPETKGRVQTEWEKYAKIVIPPNATPNQIHQLRCAFYGGFSVFYDFTLQTLGNLTDQQSETELLMIDAELAAFVEGLRKGQRYGR